MLKKSRKVLSLVLVLMMCTMIFSGFAYSSSSKLDSPTVIRIGTHWAPGIDPEWKDPVTGKPGLAPDQLQAAQKAMATVLKQQNVKIKWVQYSGDVREVLLKSVLAKDPVCDIALLWGGSQGTILNQNVVQPLDKYASIFNDADSSWMLNDKMFGHYYLLNWVLSFGGFWPLVYNIQYLDKVDALKENGKTVYPTDLWKQGKWTWSKFEEYLTKVNQYYANKKGPVRTDVPIKAFQTDYRFTAVQAIHSNGGAVYGAKGLGIATPEAKKAVAYIDELMSKKLMMSVRYGDDTPVPGWTWNGGDFANGETVFTNMVPWLSNYAGQQLAKRGESMGVVPFPRPDDIPANDPRYQQVVSTADQMVVLKGVPANKVETALKAYKLYFETYYRTLANSNKVMDFFAKNAKTEAINNGFDILNDKIGADILNAFKYISGSKANEYYTLMPWANLWSDQILGNSIYGLNGSPKYSAAVDAKKSQVNYASVSTLQHLGSDKAVDNMPPSLSLVDKQIALKKGTDPSTVSWGKYIKGVDGIDGNIKSTKIKVDASKTKFNTVGKYDNGITASVKDAAGNEGKANFTVIVFDPDNKTAPTLTAKDKPRTIKVGEDASKINWANDFVDSAVDKNKFDLKDNVTADISKLDVTTPGKYDVVLKVTDYAGNKTELKISVTVVK